MNSQNVHKRKQLLKSETKHKYAKETSDSTMQGLDISSLPEAPRKENAIASFIDKWVEPYLWNIKFVALLAVIMSLFVSVALMLRGTYETSKLIISFFELSSQEIQLHTLGIVDMFLFGMVMMIFSFGSYNLFVSKLDNVSRDTRSNEIRPKWVQVENFGELKAIFIKVVIMILIITFLELVVTNIDKFKDNIYSLLVVPAGIVLIAISLKLVHSGDSDE